MRRWHSWEALAVACRPYHPWKGFIGVHQTRLVSSSTGNANQPHRTPYDQIFAVFRKTAVPRLDRIEEWAALLDGALPPHLRDQRISPPLLTLSAVDLAEVLLAAQVPDKPRIGKQVLGHDLLYHLGFEKGRWAAVVWLVKKLVDRFPISRKPDVHITDSLSLWGQAPPLLRPFVRIGTQQGDAFSRLGWEEADHGVRHPLYLELDAAHSAIPQVTAKSLDELTGSLDEDAKYQQDLAHNALGLIWQTLGSMTQACAGGSIRQEVLEIIAYLHHREIMPMSIYQYQPTLDKTVVQQPPLIPLLSSRILTSLSDAAWRAHEKLVVEEAKARQGGRVTGPDVLAAPYRARIDGVFPEVWLELILWSCLHGGWIKQGGLILDSIVQSKDWKPLSWRQYERALPPSGKSDNDWNAWDYLFKTRPAKSMNLPSGPIPNVQQTVSAEVVNAYVDALAILPPRERAVGSRYRVMPKIVRLKHFLSKGSLALTIGSWDALAIRLIESQGELLENPIALTIKLSPGLGQGLMSKNTQDLPAYVLDGGLAMQGKLNRVLHERVLAGSLEYALQVFGDMLARADRDKQTSLAYFLEGSKPLLRALDDTDMFTSNVTGIDYPAFDLQIPTITLSVFLDLITESKSFEFGRWLLYSTDADGPVIKNDIYDDPFLTPALVRFAAATQDGQLFSTLRQLPNFSIQSVLSAQIDAMRWDAATGIVEHIAKLRGTDVPWNPAILGKVAGVMLSQIPGATSGNVECRENLRSAMRLFSNMVKHVKKDKVIFTVSIQTLLDMLSSVDASWAKFCRGLRRLEGHHDLILGAVAFNNLLEGVIAAYGSSMGRRLLRLFCPQSARRLPQTERQLPTDEAPGTQRQRIVVPLPGMSDEHKVVVYGAFAPNVYTINIILRKALEELQDPSKEDASQVRFDVGVDEYGIEAESVEKTTPRGMVAWAVRCMAGFHIVPDRHSVVRIIDTILHDVGMNDLRKALPDIVSDIAADLRDDSADDLEDIAPPEGEDSSPVEGDSAEEVDTEAKI